MKQAEILKMVQAVGGNEFNFDEWYAKCWSVKKGGYSAKLAANLIKYLTENKKTIKSCLDVCSGSGEFLNVMTNFAKECYGVDNAEGYLQYTGNKFKKLKTTIIKLMKTLN